jgi:hypothetical protein
MIDLVNCKRVLKKVESQAYLAFGRIAAKLIFLVKRKMKGTNDR